MRPWAFLLLLLLPGCADPGTVDLTVRGTQTIWEPTHFTVTEVGDVDAWPEMRFSADAVIWMTKGARHQIGEAPRSLGPGPIELGETVSYCRIDGPGVVMMTVHQGTGTARFGIDMGGC